MTDTEGCGKKTRKPYTLTKQRENWTDDEHQRFITALQVYNRDWKKIEEYVATKTVVQIRSHAQKYFQKVIKSGSFDAIPPPRPKRKAGEVTGGSSAAGSGPIGSSQKQSPSVFKRRRTSDGAAAPRSQAQPTATVSDTKSTPSWHMHDADDDGSGGIGGAAALASCAATAGPAGIGTSGDGGGTVAGGGEALHPTSAAAAQMAWFQHQMTLQRVYTFVASLLEGTGGSSGSGGSSTAAAAASMLLLQGMPVRDRRLAVQLMTLLVDEMAAMTEKEAEAEPHPEEVSQGQEGPERLERQGVQGQAGHKQGRLVQQQQQADDEEKGRRRGGAERQRLPGLSSAAWELGGQLGDGYPLMMSPGAGGLSPGPGSGRLGGSMMTADTRSGSLSSGSATSGDPGTP